MPLSIKSGKKELRVEIPLAVLLALAPFVCQMFEMPNIASVGIILLAVGLALVGRIVWIGAGSLGPMWRLVSCIVTPLVIAALLWNPIRNQIKTKREVSKAANAGTLTEQQIEGAVTRAIPKPEGFLQFSLPKTYGLPFRPRGSVSFDIQCINRGAVPITNVDAALDILLLSGSEEERRSKLHQRFSQLLSTAQTGNRSPAANIGVGIGLWGTVETGLLDANKFSELFSGTLFIYIIGHAWWKEKAEGIDLCVSMQTPELRNLTPSGIVWHVCRP
jgi:hypothetical protein